MSLGGGEGEAVRALSKKTTINYKPNLEYPEYPDCQAVTIQVGWQRCCWGAEH